MEDLDVRDPLGEGSLAPAQPLSAWHGSWDSDVVLLNASKVFKTFVAAIVYSSGTWQEGKSKETPDNLYANKS